MIKIDSAVCSKTRRFVGCPISAEHPSADGSCNTTAIVRPPRLKLHHASKFGLLCPFSKPYTYLTQPCQPPRYLVTAHRLELVSSEMIGWTSCDLRVRPAPRLSKFKLLELGFNSAQPTSMDRRNGAQRFSPSFHALRDSTAIHASCLRLHRGRQGRHL